MKQKVHGNTAGVRDRMIADLEALYEEPVLATEFLPAALAEKMAQITGELNREILIYLSRTGRVEEVAVGDSGTVDLANIRLVRNIDRLAGVRCIHTHPNGNGMLSEVDIGSLNALKLDAMCAIGVKDGKPTSVYSAYIGDLVEERRETLIYGPYRHTHLPQQGLMEAIYEADRRLYSTTHDVVQAAPERAVLAGIDHVRKPLLR